MKEQNKPSVSVLIPVYNTGDNLRLCLDSLITQSFQDFEIIAVNNGSEDNSLEILEEYREKYPEKIFIYSIPHSDFVGTGRNYALTKARGEYIYICDSDDIVEKDGLIFLYNRAEYYKADVVYGYCRFVNMQSRTHFYLGCDGEKEVTPGELILTGADYWRRLYKKSLLDEVIGKVGRIPENTNFDDVAWLPVVHSYAKKIRSADRNIYNYFRRSSSTVGGYKPSVIEYSVISEQYAMENCNPEFVEYAELYVARRIENNLVSRWLYSDNIVEHIKKNWERFENNKLIKKDIDLYQKLKKYKELTDCPMPKLVYLCNFDGKLQNSFVQYVKEKAFDKCEVRILSFDNCNIEELKKNNVPQKFAKEYFVLKSLYETGGVYLNERVIIDNPLNSLRYYNSFFGFIDKNSFSDSIFGAVKNSEVIRSIMDTYKNAYYNECDYCLDERIKNILNIRYGVKLDGQTHMFDYLPCVLAPDVICYNANYGIEMPGYFHLCCHDFTDKKEENKELYITVKNTSINTLFEKHYGSTLPKVNVPEAQGILSAERDFYKYRLEEIEKSVAFRMAVKISNMGNKRFFKGLKTLIKKHV